MACEITSADPTSAQTSFGDSAIPGPKGYLRQQEQARQLLETQFSKTDQQCLITDFEFSGEFLDELDSFIVVTQWVKSIRSLSSERFSH